MLIIKSIFKSTVNKQSLSAGHSFLQTSSYVFCQAAKTHLQQEGETKPAHGEETRGQFWQPSGGWFQMLLSPSHVLGPFLGLLLLFHFSAESVTCTGVHPVNPLCGVSSCTLGFNHFQPRESQLTVHNGFENTHTSQVQGIRPRQAQGENVTTQKYFILHE